MNQISGTAEVTLNYLDDCLEKLDSKLYICSESNAIQIKHFIGYYKSVGQKKKLKTVTIDLVHYTVLKNTFKKENLYI